MAAESVQVTVARIEEKVDGLIDRIDRHQKSLYGSGGLEPRIRGVETDLAVVKSGAAAAAKGRATWVSALISVGVGLFIWLVNWLSGLKH